MELSQLEVKVGDAVDLDRTVTEGTTTAAGIIDMTAIRASRGAFECRVLATASTRARCNDGGMAISYLIGDATAPDDLDPGVITHVCNDSGGWGKGFVLAISRRWPEPEAAYREWARSGNEFGLGMVQFVKVEDHLRVANMVAQHGYVSRANPVAIRYDALAQCLSKLAGRIEEGTLIHMPRIGCGLAGGSWDQIEPLLEEHLARAGFDVRVYDLPAK